MSTAFVRMGVGLQIGQGVIEAAEQECAETTAQAMDAGQRLEV